MKTKLITAICILFFLPSLQAQTWQKLGSGLDPYAGVHNFKVIGGELYLIGGYNYVNDSFAGGTAKFDGSYFYPLDSGVNGASDIAVYNNETYICGTFYQRWQDYNNNVFNYIYKIAKWNGTTWVPLPGDLVILGDINAMEVYNGELYVGGTITKIGNLTVQGYAKFNGSTWSTFGCTNDGFQVRDMAVYNNELIVAGIGGIPCDNTNNFYNIARWNGTQWDSLGGPAGGSLEKLFVDTINNELIIGGGITWMPGCTNIRSVAKWNGTNWSNIGSGGITNGASGITKLNGDLYVSGYWSTFNWQNDTVLAKFDGTSWTKIFGPNNSVTELGVYNGNLYVSGYFDTIVNQSMNRIACYGFTCPTNVGIKKQEKEKLTVSLYPNPANTFFYIKIQAAENKSYTTRITDATGKTMQTQTILPNTETKIDTGKLPSGIYTIEVCNSKGDVCHAEKFVLE